MITVMDDRTLERLARSKKLDDDRRFDSERGAGMSGTSTAPRPVSDVPEYDDFCSKPVIYGRNGARVLTPEYIHLLDVAETTGRAVGEVSYCFSVLGSAGLNALKDVAHGGNWSEIADAAILYGKGPILDALVAINRLKDEYGHSFPSLAKAVVTLGADEAEAVLAEPRFNGTPWIPLFLCLV